MQSCSTERKHNYTKSLLASTLRTSRSEIRFVFTFSVLISSGFMKFMLMAVITAILRALVASILHWRCMLQIVFIEVIEFRAEKLKLTKIQVFNLGIFFNSGQKN